MISKFTTIILILIGLTSSVFATPQVSELTCVSVQSNGDIQLTWTEVTDFGASFTSYEIFASTSATGPFTSIYTEPDETITTYTSNLYDGNAGSVYFYMETNSAVVTNSQSVTLNSIYLTINNAGDGVANLSWNQMHTPDVNTPNTVYNIYREYPTGIWTNIGSTTYGNEIYTHVNSGFCDNPEEVNYRVDIENSCTSQSNVKGDFFINDPEPIRPTFTNVTVDHSSGAGDVTITWDPSPSLDVTGYIIYYNHPQTGWGELVTVFGINTTSYTHVGGGNDAAAEYTISAIDPCGTTYSTQTEGLISTVRVWASKYPIDPTIPDECKPHTLLTWNSNVMPSGVSKYKVYCSNNGGDSYYFLAEINSDTTEYIDERELDPTITYFYYIEAISNNGTTSLSNFITANPGATLSVEFIYANHASITDYNKVELSFTIDTTANMKEFRLLKSEYIDEAYNIIATFDNSHKQITYYDNIDIDNEIYHYKLVAVNICDDVPDTSNITTNIVNRAYSEGMLKHRIEWSEYFEFSGNIKKYDIYQVIDNKSPERIASVSSDIQSYHINNIDINAYGLEGNFCYYVEAIEDVFHPMGIRDTSRSNISCVAEQHYLYLPTAFTPDGDGINDKFIPGIAYPSHNKFLFNVYNKWGEVIYNSTSPLEGWDGRVNGKYAEPGVYVYLVRFFTAKNELIEKRSTFTLIR